MMSSWQEIGLQKRTLRDSLIPEAWKIEKKDYPSGSNVLHVPETCGILSAEELQITSKYDAVDIVSLIKDGTYNAEAVTTAFCKRAAIAQQLVRKIGCPTFAVAGNSWTSFYVHWARNLAQVYDVCTDCQERTLKS